jgi:hypothetical protein
MLTAAQAQVDVAGSPLISMRQKPILSLAKAKNRQGFFPEFVEDADFVSQDNVVDNILHARRSDSDNGYSNSDTSFTVSKLSQFN